MGNNTLNKYMIILTNSPICQQQLWSSLKEMRRIPDHMQGGVFQIPALGSYLF